MTENRGWEWTSQIRRTRLIGGSRLWYGVEWDNLERGKHDGSHEGVQYFTCRNPKGGSFVRPAKVSFGVDFLTVVREKYTIDTEEVMSQDISISSRKLKWLRVKERSYENLPSVLLSRSEVNGAGAEGDIRETTPNVQWLDMCGTLLSCWEDVAAITQQLEHLEGLQLSNNRLRDPSEVSSLCRSFCSLRTLALNNCDLTWTQILECAPMWPQLEVLSLGENNITELRRPEGVLQSLKNLNVSSNPLEQNTVLSIAALPRLEELNLSKTGLSDIRFDDAAPGSQTDMFPALKTLRLDYNKITSLVIFSCRGNRLLSSDGNPRTANQMLIAKLGKLELLNNSTIVPDDRKGAECDYMKMFGLEWLEAGGGSELSREFIIQHPRYLSLVQKYGAPDEGLLKKLVPLALKNQLLKITFVFPDHPDRKPIEKKLPAAVHRFLTVPLLTLTLGGVRAVAGEATEPREAQVRVEQNSPLAAVQFGNFHRVAHGVGPEEEPRDVIHRDAFRALEI
ncbi:hypothetical protein F7725_006000 [Dissostichus mawsoni]|uniref:Tubulin-specific chaperone E n=1 Tax=Dissostichus mawsoni TaxID=36200 RepID=A0A7J5YT51_DISMA|nr:hypothetical protein F7725_006000 [Dissostichus mawsoni]